MNSTIPTETPTGASAMSIEMVEDPSTFHQGTKIKVIGVGGGGGNAVEHMIKSGVRGVEFICANTDAQVLDRIGADLTINLGRNGLGAGGKPDVGREVASASEAEIREALQGADMVFVTAGMGGGTGTGAAPVVARVARELGILTVGVVTKPFDWEGGRRMKNANIGIAELEKNVDSLIVVLNDKLQEVLGDDVTQDQAFASANDVLRNAVGGIAEIINVPGNVNVDFQDVRAVMESPGKALLGTATAKGVDRAATAAQEAVRCPLLEGQGLAGAKGVLVLVTASRATLKLSESKIAMQAITALADPDANVIYGTAFDESLGDELRVTVVATGLSQAQQVGQIPQAQLGQAVSAVAGQTAARMATVSGAAVAMPSLRTGTDDVDIIPTLTQPVGFATPAGGTTLAHPSLRPVAGGGSPQVWTTRTSAAERVDALTKSGMDESEIPAFLRKQAD
jgi:cell division protein FtsZ